MIPNLKVLGLALIAALAISAMGASVSQARPTFTCSSYPCTATGSNTKGSEVITAGGQTVECNGHFVTPSISEASSEIWLTPTYTNCKAFGFASATVSMNGCGYELLGHEKLVGGHYIHWLDIACPAGKAIVIFAGNCELTISSQSSLAWFTTNNEVGPLKIKPEVLGMTVNVTKDGFLCPFAGTGHTTASYKGEVIVSRVGGGVIAVTGE